jgi:hypothetical protein
MTIPQMLLAGPAFALLGLMLFAIPGLRPRMFTRTIGWLGACMCAPMVAGFLFDSFGLTSLAFLVKPIGSLIAPTLFLGFVTICFIKRFSLLTALPTLMLLFGSIADIYAVRQLASGWGGASC